MPAPLDALCLHRPYQPDSIARISLPASLVSACLHRSSQVCYEVRITVLSKFYRKQPDRFEKGRNSTTQQLNK